MAKHMDGISVTFKGMPVSVQSFDVQASQMDKTTRITIDGFITDEQHYRNREDWLRDQMRYPEHYGGGSGIGVSADQFINTPIGHSQFTDGYVISAFDWGDTKSDPVSDIQKYTERMMGGGKMREGTQGSYAYGVAQLAEGLKSAVESGWITDEEAKTEMRGNIAHTAKVDQEAKYAADRIKQLEEELESLKAEKD